MPGTGKSESRWRSCVDEGWEFAAGGGKEKARGLPRAGAGFAAGVAVPVPPAKRIAERMDFAALALVDDPDRYKPDGVTGSGEAPEDFGFDFEMAGRGGEVGPGIELHEAKAVLGIREFAAGEAGELAAHPAVDLATEPRHARGWVMRLPTMRRAPICSAHWRKAGRSSGACWPSPSMVIAQVNPC